MSRRAMGIPCVTREELPKDSRLHFSCIFGVLQENYLLFGCSISE
jgi:hypothetical protein